jgi:hypothetical protein
MNYHLVPTVEEKNELYRVPFLAHVLTLYFGNVARQ